MFEGDDEEQQPCVMCHQPNQQMLMLSCVHDPCINCAAKHYVDNEPHNSLIYTCAKCGQETELDRSSILELQKLYTSIMGKRKNKTSGSAYREQIYNEKPPSRSRNDLIVYSRGREPQESVVNKYHPTAAPVSQPSYFGSKKAAYQTAYPCQDHPDQELTYYCFTCNRPICPECAIHGLHRDHEVQTTRKAIKQIKQLLLEDRQKIDQEMSQIASGREQAKRLSKEWVQENKRDQEYIRKKIAHLKAVISEKEKQLLRSCDSNLEKNCDILRTEASSSDKSLEVLMNVKKNIDSTLKKQDLTVLQEFNKRDDQANEALRFGDSEKDNIRQQQIKNPLKCSDVTLLEEEIDRLIGDVQTLKLSTTIPQ